MCVMFEWFMPSLVFQYLSGRASKASVITSAVYSYLRSILTAGRGVVVFLLDYDVREIYVCDVRVIYAFVRIWKYYLSGRASKASVITSAVYSYLRSILTAGGARGCRVPFRLWCSRDFIWCSRDSLDILILYYTSLLFHSVANIYFFLWFFSFFDAGGYSLEHPTLFHPSILTYGLFLRRGAGGGLFSLFCSHYYLPHHFSSQHFIGGRKWLT